MGQHERGVGGGVDDDDEGGGGEGRLLVCSESDFVNVGSRVCCKDLVHVFFYTNRSLSPFEKFCCSSSSTLDLTLSLSSLSTATYVYTRMDSEYS